MSRLLRRGFSTLKEARQVPLKVSKPLRVLFCGSDEFSSASLRALHAEHERNPELVKSIDVMLRPGKPSGRSLKRIREVPVKAVAQALGLSIHERDTFTGWELPRPQEDPINLIVAVSFGLFVPPRILKSAEYGGLNVHPSLLPSFRGPAPIQHTILAKESHSGVTLQTLDDKIFDHGIILAQTPEPWVPIPESCTYSELHDVLAPLGAQMLVEGLRNGVHVPPLKEIPFPKRSGNFLHAPKITSADRKIIWGKKGNFAPGIRALGRMWSEFYVDATKKKRCIFEDVEESEETFPSSFVRLFRGDNLPRTPTAEELAVKFVMVEGEQDEAKAPLFYVEDGDTILIGEPGMPSDMIYSKSVKQRFYALRVKNITLEGQGSKPAAVVMRSLNRKGKWELKAERELNQYNKVSGYHWTVGNFVENAKDRAE